MSHNRTWQDNIVLGRQLVGEINDRKWELGDLANEVCPAGGIGERDNRLSEFASEIGITPSTLNDYRLIAKAWPVSARALTQTWTTHRALAGRDDRFDIIAEQTWTYNSLSDRLGRLPNPTRVDRETGEINDVSKPINPEALAAAIKSDPQMAGAAMTALDERYAAAAAKRKIKPEQKKDTNRDVYGDTLSMVISLRQVHKTLEVIAGLAQNIRGDAEGETREALRTSVGSIRAMCDIIETAANGGLLDSQLADLIEQETGK